MHNYSNYAYVCNIPIIFSKNMLSLCRDSVNQILEE